MEIGAYTIAALREEWKAYHKKVHRNCMVPCDANPGDDCSVEAFLFYLEEKQGGPHALERIIKSGA